MLLFFLILFSETGKWSIYTTPTEIIPPSYGHSSVYDPVGKLIYVYGGIASVGSDKLSTALTSYDPKARIWYVPVRGFEQNHVHVHVLIRGVLKRFFFFP